MKHNDIVAIILVSVHYSMFLLAMCYIPRCRAAYQEEMNKMLCTTSKQTPQVHNVIPFGF